jgi:hypothetical protein
VRRFLARRWVAIVLCWARGDRCGDRLVYLSGICRSADNAPPRDRRQGGLDGTVVPADHWPENWKPLRHRALHLTAIPDYYNRSPTDRRPAAKKNACLLRGGHAAVSDASRPGRGAGVTQPVHHQ